jgi:hypothetical protein
MTMSLKKFFENIAFTAVLQDPDDFCPNLNFQNVLGSGSDLIRIRTDPDPT